MVRQFRVNDALAVGRDQPSADDFSEIAALGFRAILDLRQEGEGQQALPPSREAEAVEERGMRYAHLPIPADRLDAAMLDRCQGLLRDLPKPAFVHCASGKRSGTFVLAQAGSDAGLSGDKVVERIAEAGAAYGSDEMRETVRQWVDRRRRAGAGNPG